MKRKVEDTEVQLSKRAKFIIRSYGNNWHNVDLDTCLPELWRLLTSKHPYCVMFEVLLDSPSAAPWVCGALKYASHFGYAHPKCCVICVSLDRLDTLGFNAWLDVAKFEKLYSAKTQGPLPFGLKTYVEGMKRRLRHNKNVWQEATDVITNWIWGCVQFRRLEKLLYTPGMIGYELSRKHFTGCIKQST